MEGFTILNSEPKKEIFKKNVWNLPHLKQLRLYSSIVRANSFLSTAYFIKIRTLTEHKIRGILYDVLTARPKSKKFQGRETRLPWPMYHERGQWVAIPRYFGVKIFGIPKKITLTDGIELVNITPKLPLYNSETCAAAHNIDQEHAVAKTLCKIESLKQKHLFGAVMYCISAGYGKTCCAAHMISKLGRKTLFVVPNETFFEQMAKEMRTFLGDVIRIGQLRTSNKRFWDTEDKDIVFTTFKSIATIQYDLSEFGTVIVDEAHETSTPSLSQMYFRFPCKNIILLTATPERAADHCGGYLQWLAGPIAWYQMRDIACISWGGVEVTIYNVKYNPPIKETKSRDGEVYWEGITRQLVKRKSRNDYIMNEILFPRHRAGRRIIVVGTRVAHMETIQTELWERFHIPTGLIVGEYTNKQEYYWVPDGEGGMVKRHTSDQCIKLTPRESKLMKQQPIIVANVSIVAKALNIPELDTLLVLNNAFTNDTFWTQCIGRITRHCTTKQHPELILMRDCCDSQCGDGIFATCVDSACRTLKKQSDIGYSFSTVEINLN